MKHVPYILVGCIVIGRPFHDTRHPGCCLQHSVRKEIKWTSTAEAARSIMFVHEYMSVVKQFHLMLLEDLCDIRSRNSAAWCNDLDRLVELAVVDGGVNVG
jgi:hypothetical protein